MWAFDNPEGRFISRSKWWKGEVEPPGKGLPFIGVIEDGRAFIGAQPRAVEVTLALPVSRSTVMPLRPSLL